MEIDVSEFVGERRAIAVPPYIVVGQLAEKIPLIDPLNRRGITFLLERILAAQADAALKTFRCIPAPVAGAERLARPTKKPTASGHATAFMAGAPKSRKGYTRTG